jgi:hypothetical protein
VPLARLERARRSLPAGYVYRPPPMQALLRRHYQQLQLPESWQLFSLIIEFKREFAHLLPKESPCHPPTPTS